MDRFSPVAPAYVRVLVLPVGEIERSIFLDFLGRLQKEASIIKLAEVEPYIGDDELLLSPKVFPQGSILYNYTSSVPNQQQEQLSPFELFREPLLVVGVVDRRRDENGDDEKELGAAADYLRERHPRVVHRQLLFLEELRDGYAQAEDSVIRVKNAADTGDSSLREAVCQISVRFLTELTIYTRAMQASPSIQTPGQTARSLQRTSSNRDQEKRPTSGRSTPAQSTGASSPVDENSSKPPPLNRESPATSFDQIPSANSVPSGVSRSDSLASNRSKHSRASSQDRVSVQGFGSGTSQDKLKHRGKARVGIVIGSIYIMAGQWSEGLRILVENTNKARMLSDHIWHAKGLEDIIVCLLLHAWAGLEFQIPSICYPVSERTSSAHVQRFSVNLPSDFRPAEAAQQASVRRLSTSLPDLLKLVLSLYRSVEGSLELPLVCVSEATIRFSKLLAALHNAGNELDRSMLDYFIRKGGVSEAEAKRNTSSNTSKGLSKTAIADILSQARPTGEDTMPIADHVAILAGIASVYSLLQMHRKKASLLKDLISKLAIALTQARKRGAAEMGIHPAASLSADTGAEAILAITEDSRGVYQMMSEIAQIYGLRLPDLSTTESDDSGRSFFGGDNLKAGVLRDLAAFCEASPDPYGVLRLNTSTLRSLGPDGAVDTESDVSSSILSKDDQVRLTTTITRTIGVSKHLGLPQVEATYWDRFLVRGVEFVPPDPSKEVIDRSKLKPAAATAQEGTKDGNPLLYDPNAKGRPGTAGEEAKTQLLVDNEVSVCLVTLQNPNEVSVEIESLSLVTEEVELKTSHQSIVLHPMRLQQVSLSVFPCSTGDCKITGCRVKVSGCVEQDFLIVNKPWSAMPPTLLKDLGQDSRLSAVSGREQQDSSPDYATVSATVIEPQPLLVLENNSLLESSMMLLDGEKKDLRVVVRNTSSIGISVFDVLTTNNALRLRPGSDGNDSNAATSGGYSGLAKPISIDPGSNLEFEFLATGRPSVSQTQILFYYSRQHDDAEHARVLSVAIDMTVNAAVQVQHLDVMPLSEYGADDSCALSFDIRNAWPKALSYDASFTVAESIQDGHPTQEDVLAPGELQRVYLPIPRLRWGVAPGASGERTRDVLLKGLHVSWSGEGRVGEVDVSGLALGPEALELIIGTPIHISLQLVDASAGSFVKTGSFVTLRATIVNHQAGTCGPLFTQLRTRNANSMDSVHDERRVAFAGTLHRVVPPLSEGEEATVDFAICPLVAGMIELEMVAKSNDGHIATRLLPMRVVQDFETHD